MPTARDGVKLAWLENRIWAIGGNDGSNTNKVESYDLATDTWQAEASLTTARNWLLPGLLMIEFMLGEVIFYSY